MEQVVNDVREEVFNKGQKCKRITWVFAHFDDFPALLGPDDEVANFLSPYVELGLDLEKEKIIIICSKSQNNLIKTTI